MVFPTLNEISKNFCNFLLDFNEENFFSFKSSDKIVCYVLENIKCCDSKNYFKIFRNA